MKEHSKGKFIAKGIVFGTVAAVVLTVAVMLLWNWLMPLIFGLTVITFWQSLGILALSKILFGGTRHGKSWRNKEQLKLNKEHFHARMMKERGRRKQSCQETKVEE